MSKLTKRCAKCMCVCIRFWCENMSSHVSVHLCPCLSVIPCAPPVFRASPDLWHLFLKRGICICMWHLLSHVSTSWGHFPLWLMSLIVRRGDKTLKLNRTFMLWYEVCSLVRIWVFPPTHSQITYPFLPFKTPTRWGGRSFHVQMLLISFVRAALLYCCVGPLWGPWMETHINVPMALLV